MAAANRLEARFSRKRATTWVGYKVHLSKTGEANQPHLITQSDRRCGSYHSQYRCGFGYLTSDSSRIG